MIAYGAYAEYYPGERYGNYRYGYPSLFTPVLLFEYKITYRADRNGIYQKYSKQLHEIAFLYGRQPVHRVQRPIVVIYFPVYPKFFWHCVSVKLGKILGRRSHGCYGIRSEIKAVDDYLSLSHINAFCYLVSVLYIQRLGARYINDSRVRRSSEAERRVRAVYRVFKYVKTLKRLFGVESRSYDEQAAVFYPR